MTFGSSYEWKNWLLKFDTSSNIEEEYFKKLEKCFEELLIVLADNNTDEKKRVECIDNVGLLLLKLSQVLKNCDNIDLKERIKNNLLMVERATFLFQYVIDFWTDNTVSLELPLRNMFSKLLKLLNQLYGKYMGTLLEQWLGVALSLQNTMKVRYFLIEVFADEMDLASIQELCPEFLDTCLDLLHAEHLCTPIGKCLSKYLLNLYQNHYTDATLSNWLDLWKYSCCERLQDSKLTKRIKIYVLSPVFKQVPGSFKGFLGAHEKFSPQLLLSLLEIGQELGIEEEPFHEEKFISFEDLVLLFQHDEYKLSTFELLTYSTKRSRQIQPYVYDLLRDNLIYFFVDYSVQTRNYFHGSLKLFINRIRDSTYSLNREALKLSMKGVYPERQKFNLQQVENAKNFMSWLLNFLKSQVTPGSQYQRRSLALKVLLTMIVSGIDDTIPEKYLDTKQRMEYPFHIRIFDKSLLRLLVDQLMNDFDDIRDDSLFLLKLASESMSSESLMECINCSIHFEKSLDMLSSYKSGDGGAKVCEFLFMISREQIKFFEKVLLHLRTLIDNAKSSLIENISVPVAGIFTALAYLVKRYTFSGMDDIEFISQSCIQLIIENWNTVQEIVSHDSTEGTLPKKYLNCGISNQVITSYAFRSIKESSLLLKSLLAHAPLSLDQIYQIGNLLIAQLSRVRHSGAFQSIFPTFLELCTRAMKDCPDQLEKWLYSSIESIQTKSQHVTRRSGGLPLMITAILSVERNKDRRWLGKTFTKLFEIANEPVVNYEERLDLPQVHAFNCIRAIYMEPKLSYDSSPFVSSALNLCLENFTSSIWSLRNCSVMLFTALQNRFFGKAGKSTSARLFFTRFGGVREALVAHLRNAFSIAPIEEENQVQVDKRKLLLTSQSKIESVFLVSTILSRLKPTKGYEGLDEFKIEIHKALTSENWKIREMASKTLPAMTEDPMHEALNVINSLLSNTLHQDKIHGSLLAVKELLLLELDKHISGDSFEKIIKLLVSNFDLFLWRNRCYITAKIFVEIIHMLLDSKVVSKEHQSKIVCIFGNYFIRENSTKTQDGSKQLLLAKLTKILIEYESKENIPEVILLSLYSEYFEVQLAAVTALTNVELSSETGANIFDALRELIEDERTWTPIKASALYALEKNGVQIPSGCLNNLLMNKSELIQSSVLANLTVFECIGEPLLLKLTQEHSSDVSPTHMRLSSAKCLINSASKSPTLDVIFKLYLMLSDDDYEIRTKVSKYFTEHFIKTFKSTSTLIPSAIANRMTSLLPQLFCHEKLASVVLETFLKTVSSINSNEVDTYDSKDELFAKERDNQFRNNIELGNQLIDILKSLNSPQISTAVKILESEFYKDIKLFDTQDACLRWDSNPDIFTRLLLLRNFIGVFGTDLTSVDTVLKEKNSHPYLLEHSF